MLFGGTTKQQVWLELHDYDKYKRESPEEQGIVAIAYTIKLTKELQMFQSFCVPFRSDYSACGGGRRTLVPFLDSNSSGIQYSSCPVYKVGTSVIGWNNTNFV